ncbi:MAG: oligosaccharyl transferase, archaeosortase A system-associated [Methanomicrobiales archaeon]|nr:oligosaccharyl transferase, archaeosortase A system-associated [Methanomicrobiales archaeon]MDI6876813.1 oligosaccharyl transferase, archaeosortase A system-associated [Methanomicrobiales archaeon]
MDREFFDKNRKYVIIGLILLFFAVSAGIRLIPMPAIVHAWGVAVYENDPWYTLRQIEIVVANYPGYTWYDPLTAYPSGKVVDWGPLFPFVAATACLICGAATRAEIMMVASWIPPLLAALLVPAMYLLGKSLADGKTGLLAAALVAIVPGQFFYKSLFGYVDHHVAEVFFSTLFCLGYIAALRCSRQSPVDFRRVETLRTPALLAAATGVLYLLGLLTMPTMILFGLLVMLYTPVQGAMDAASRRSSGYLLLLNGIAFGIGIAGLLAFGTPHDGLSLSRYSLGHPIAYMLLILGTAAVVLLSRYFRGRAVHYILALGGIGAAGAGVIALAAPAVFEAFAAGGGAFFSSTAEVLTIVEARPWTIGQAWFSFQTGLILMAGGLGLLAVRVYRERRAEGLFVIVWSLLILLATWAHWRYEYYLSVNVALLSAVLVGGVARHCWEDLHILVSRRAEDAARNPAPKDRKEKRRKAHPSSSRRADPGKALAMGGAIVLLALFCAHAVQYDFQSATRAHTTSISEPWYETLVWVQNHTPDPGVEYLALYDRDAFRYPEGSYGILSWWDYGHWITFLARRMPNTNPFQDNAAGPSGVAGFLMAESEDRAEEVLHRLGSKYVITDTSMANPLRFASIAAWYNPSAGMSPYVQEFLVQDPSGSYRVTSLGTERYYATMVARLHNFDGSMAEPADALYIEYGMAENRPVIVRSASMPLREAEEAARRYNDHAPAGYHAAVRSSSLVKPLSEIPALAHFRLVHESSSDGGPAVKVFEYVPGARVAGEGIVELNLTTPAGRTFTYRQESRNGEFVLPYSTLGNPYPVKADGRYRIIGTDREFDVSEEQVQRGEAAG